MPQFTYADEFHPAGAIQGKAVNASSPGPCQLHNHWQVPRRDFFMRWKKCLGFSLAAVLGGTLTAQGQNPAPATLPYSSTPVPYRTVMQVTTDQPPAPSTPPAEG